MVVHSKRQKTFPVDLLDRNTDGIQRGEKDKDHQLENDGARIHMVKMPALSSVGGGSNLPLKKST